MREYTVSGTIKVNASFMTGQLDNVEEARAPVALELARQRLEHLESSKAGEPSMMVSQKEYTDRIEKLHEALQDAWQKEERVLALKLAIRCAKMLGDASVPGFYPSMFVLITEFLDHFGNLVFTRIKYKSSELEEEGEKSSKRGPALAEDFVAAHVSVGAKEMCRNWFYKTACIRELLPRLLIEVALLRCYRFLSDNEFPAICARLTSIARGVGDPLVAAYVRAYIARAGLSVGAAVDPRSFVVASLHDYCFSYKEFKDSARMERTLRAMSLTEPEYLHLHAPALGLLIAVIADRCGQEEPVEERDRAVFQTLLQYYRDYSGSSTFLHCILNSFPAPYYAANAAAVAALIKQSVPGRIGHTECFDALGRRLQQAAQPPAPEQKMPLLNEAWKVIARCESFPPYISAATSWLELLIKHYSQREVLILLQDISGRVSQAAPEQSHSALPALERLVRVLVERSADYGNAILTSDHLFKMMDMFDAARKKELSKSILEAFAARPKLADPVTIHTLFDVGRTLHNTLDSLSPEGERVFVSRLICSIVDHIDFGRDLEQALNVYVECRSAFSNLELVNERLVQAVAALAMTARALMRGRHSKKTAAFVKACLAYCHITIPSIDSPFRQLRLLLLCGEVAVSNQCLPQTDTFFKAAISLLPELPTREEVDGKQVSVEPRLLSFVRSFAAALLVVPGHPEHGPFYLVRGLLNALGRFPWLEGGGNCTRLRINISLLPLLAAYGQRKLPPAYAVPGVESNDALYGGAPAYLEELQGTVDALMADIIAQLTALGESGQPGAREAQSQCVLELVDQSLGCMALNTSTAAMLTRLLELVARNQRAEANRDVAAHFAQTVAFVRRKADVTTRGGRAAGSGAAAAEQAAGFQTLARALAAF